MITNQRVRILVKYKQDRMATFMEEQLSFLSLHPFSFLLLFFFFLILFVKWLSTRRATHKTLPPSPPKLPILGNLHQLSKYPYKALLPMSQRYGPLMLLHLGKVPTLVVSSPQAAEEIMKTHDSIFASRPKTTMMKKLFYDSKDVLCAPYGEYWRQIRSICVHQLLSKKRVQSFDTVRREEISILMERIVKSGSLPFDLSGMFLRLANDMISRVALGRKYSGGDGASKIKRMLEELVDLLGRFNIGDHISCLAWVDHVNGINSKADRLANQFDELVDGVIEEHLNSEEKERYSHSIDAADDRKDFVHVLLQLQRDSDSSFSIKRDSVKALILDMFAGGSDSIYATLEWAMTEILRHPKVMEKLQNEVRRIGKGQQITENDLEKMQYLKAIIKETFRLHPPVPLLFPRESTKDVKLMGYDIPAGTMVLVNVWAIGRDPMVWDEPEKFHPERFMDTDIDFKGQFFQLIPFGAGRRGCPGIPYATAIIELLLANLMNRFDWKLPGGMRTEDLDIAEKPGISIHRKFPLIVVATPRF